MDFFSNADELLGGSGGLPEGDRLLPTDQGDAIFGPYTKTEFLNDNKILNATNFFTFAPFPMQTYYWTIVKRNLEWYYGYVYGIHNAGILSSKMGSKICKMAAQLTIGGGFRFEGTERAEKFLDAFCKRRQTEGKLKQKLPIHNAVGFTLAKVDIEMDGELDVNFIQGNRYYAQTDDERNVLSYYAVIKVISANSRQKDAENTEGYFLVEERFYRHSKPVQRYRIYKGPVIATSPTFGNESSTEKGIEFIYLPDHVQHYIVKRFGRDILNKCFQLPFKDIGARIIPNTYGATGMDEYSCFADSTLADIHTQLYELDLTKTQKNESKYICQDFVAMPDTMIQSGIVASDEQRAYALEMQSNGFNKRIVKKARYIDPTHAVPFIYQPELKTDIYNNDINQILNEIAAGAQFSPITLAGYLHNGVEKTAREITADENATRLTVKDKRALIADVLNDLFAIVLEHYGIVDESGKAEECSLVFNDGSLSNPAQELEILEKKQANGWISRKTATLLANPQFSRREAAEEIRQIQEEEREQEDRERRQAFGQAPLDGADYYGEGIDASGQGAEPAGVGA